jgi:hypothetical protein
MTATRTCRIEDVGYADSYASFGYSFVVQRTPLAAIALRSRPLQLYQPMQIATRRSQISDHVIRRWMPTRWCITAVTLSVRLRPPMGLLGHESNRTNKLTQG